MIANPLLWLFLAGIAGSLLQLWLVASVAVWLWLAVAAVVGLIVALLTRRAIVVNALVVVACLAALAAAMQGVYRPQLVDPACDDATALWKVRVDAPIERITTRRESRDATGQRTAVVLLAKQCHSKWVPARGRVGVTFYGEAQLLRNDIVLARLRIDGLSPRRNPTDANPDDMELRFALQGRASSRGAYAVVERAGGFYAALDASRHWTALRLENNLTPRTAALTKALVLGDRGDVSAATKDAWADSGLSHLLAVSGLHVAFCTALIFACVVFGCAFLPGAGERFSVRRVAAVVTLPLIIIYCIWTGASPSAVRSVVMAASCLAALFVREPHATPNALGMAGLGIMFFDPASLYDPGFLLSFAAVASLLAVPSATSSGSRMSSLWHAVKNLFLLSVLATLVTAPITAFYFGRVSIASPFANLIGVPLSTWVATPIAFAYVVLLPWIELQWLARLLETIMVTLDKLAIGFAELPLAALNVPRPTLVEVIAYLALLLCLLFGVRASILRRHRFWRGAQVALAVLLLACAIRVGHFYLQPELRVSFVYVGQGDGAIIQLPYGKVAVVDAGGSAFADGWDPGRGAMAPMLRSMGIQTIDLLILTHPHPDHYGGLVYLSKHFGIKELWWNGEGENNSVVQALITRVESQGGNVRLAANLPPVQTLSGVTFEIFHPRPHDPSTMNRTYDSEGLPYYPVLSTNDNSITIKLTYGERTLLLTGDIELDAEAALVREHGATERLRADILKVAHHGSKTSSSDALLDAVRPKLAVISCGEHNPFKFPHPEVLSRFDTLKIPVWRTDTDGLVTIVTEGKVWRADGYLSMSQLKVGL